MFKNASGALFGLGGALALTRLMKTLLFDVSATDPLTFIVIAALLIIVTLMLLYVLASSRVLSQLQRELTALERTQVKRLTNSPPAAAATTVSPSNVSAPAKSPVR